jgi:GxxExxY protein
MNGWTQKKIEELTYTIIGCAIEVNKQIEPGLLESLYERCLILELENQGLRTSSQQNIPLIYRGESLNANLRLDILVENHIIMEVKAVDKIHPIHTAASLLVSTDWWPFLVDKRTSVTSLPSRKTTPAVT